MAEVAVTPKRCLHYMGREKAPSIGITSLEGKALGSVWEGVYRTRSDTRIPVRQDTIRAGRKIHGDKAQDRNSTDREHRELMPNSSNPEQLTLRRPQKKDWFHTAHTNPPLLSDMRIIRYGKSSDSPRTLRASKIKLEVTTGQSASNKTTTPPRISFKTTQTTGDNKAASVPAATTQYHEGAIRWTPIEISSVLSFVPIPSAASRATAVITLPVQAPLDNGSPLSNRL
ncbi:uncharacterized protein RHO25_005562 [Cercospora beticola]|uniref:Uncharacterized protein n=1 Tax=Cercospora beticola TaxID=122368 RepID=A0ABZ0NMZ0_CERBT|nr:hypothetical protein RHO25_005562 [Cercospora beticola]